MLSMFLKKGVADGQFYFDVINNHWAFETLEGDILSIQNAAHVPELPISFYEIEFMYSDRAPQIVKIRTCEELYQKDLTDLALAI